MITVQIKKSEVYNSLQLKGHAGFNDPGKDIVCASATILAYSLAQELANLEQKKICTIKEMIFDDGYIRIDVYFKQKSKAYRSVIDMAECGYKLLSHEYKDYIVMER